MADLKPGECRLNAWQVASLARGERVSAYVGSDNRKGQVGGIRITLVAAAPQDSPPTAARGEAAR